MKLAIRLSKAKGFPVGTVRDWKGKKYKKEAAGKWVEQGEGRKPLVEGIKHSKLMNMLVLLNSMDVNKEELEEQAKKSPQAKELLDNFDDLLINKLIKVSTDPDSTVEVTDFGKQMLVKFFQPKSEKKPEPIVQGMDDLFVVKTLEKIELSTFTKEDITTMFANSPDKMEQFNKLLSAKLVEFDENNKLLVTTKGGKAVFEYREKEKVENELSDEDLDIRDEDEEEPKGEEERKKDQPEENPEDVEFHAALARWVKGGVLLQNMRDAVVAADGFKTRVPTEAPKSYREEDLQKWTKAMLSKIIDLGEMTVYRGSDNPRWQNAEVGDEIPFGIASFSKEKDIAYDFTGGGEGIILELRGKLKGIDIEAEIEKGSWFDKEMQVPKFYGSNHNLSNYLEEREVSVRVPKLKVVEKRTDYIERPHWSKPRAMTVVVLEPVEMEKARKRKMNKKLMWELYEDFNKPLSRRTKTVKKSILFIKARKQSPEGAIKKYPSGLIYKKEGKKWVYVAKVGTKKGDDILEEAKKKGLYVSAEAKPDVKPEPEKKEPEKKPEPEKKEEVKVEDKSTKKVEAEVKKQEESGKKKSVRDYLKPPSYEQFKDFLKEKYRIEVDIPLKPEERKKLEELGISNFEDLDNAIDDKPKYESVRHYLGQGHYGMSRALMNAEYMLSSLVKIRELTGPSPKVPVADSFFVRDNGIQVQYRVSGYSLPSIDIPFEAVDAFIKNNPQINKHYIKRLKQDSNYKKWLVKGGTDPVIDKAKKDFEKETGLELNFNNYGYKGIMLNAAYINVLTKTFQETNKYYDMKKYVPPDGQKMKVRLIRASAKGYKGTYTEHDKTINISPTLPGTITHEVGHYFWERSQNMQTDFVIWAKSVGLMDKIKETLTRKSPDKVVMAKHIDSTFNMMMKDLFKDADTLTGVKKMVGEGKISKDAFNKGLYAVTHLARSMMKKNDGAMPVTGDLQFPRRAVSSFSNFSDTYLVSLAGAMHTASPEEMGTDVQETIQTLKDFREVVKVLKVNQEWDTYFDQRIYGIIKLASRMQYEEDLNFRTQQYRKDPPYWLRYTEVFARTFRTYIAKKAGIPEFKNSQEEEDYWKKQVPTKKGRQKAVRESPIGWGFPEADPTYDMIEKDGKLEALLNKYIGSEVLKSMILLGKLFMKTRIPAGRIEIAGSGFKPGLKLFLKAKPYPEGTVRSWGGKKYKKVTGKWVPVSEGKTKDERITEKNGKKKEQESPTVKGTPEIFAALKEIKEGGSKYLDDVKGSKDAKLYNSMTKTGLISWKHVGKDEYKAVLTPAGENAIESGLAEERRSQRVTEEKDKWSRIEKGYSKNGLAMAKGTVSRVDKIPGGTGVNESHLVTYVAEDGTEVRGIEKPQTGERYPVPFIPLKSTYKREAAAYSIAKSLGFDFVPETVIRREQKEGREAYSSVQHYHETGKSLMRLKIPGDGTFNEIHEIVPKEKRLEGAVFDFIICNQDRHSNNMLWDGKNLVMIDNSYSLPTSVKAENFLRCELLDTETVGAPIPDNIMNNMKKVYDKSDEMKKKMTDLGIEDKAVDLMFKRIGVLLNKGYIPHDMNRQFRTIKVKKRGENK